MGLVLTSLKCNFAATKHFKMSEKIDLSIKQNLFSANNEMVVSAIHAIKERGNKQYLPILFDVLNAGPDPEIESEIAKLLGTVKDKTAVNTFMRAVEDPGYKSIRKKILTACWQNGLDYSNFVPVFIDLVVAEDWEVAFEAFTVVDNLEMLPSPEIVQAAEAKIELAIAGCNEQKQYFLNEIRSKFNG